MVNTGMPRVGVVIANCNKERYLRVCLDSVIAQTWPAVQVIIVDDRSEDGSREIIGTYARAHDHIRVIENPRRLGVAGARNAGFAALDTEWASTLDSDDFYCHPDKLRLEMEAACAAEPGPAMAFSGIRLVDADGNTIPAPRGAAAVSEGWLFERILSRSCLIPRDFVFPRALFDEVGGYDPDMPIYEDWDLKIRLARRLEFVYTGVEGIAYRQNTGGLSAATRAAHRHWLHTVFERYVEEAGDPEALRAAFEKNIRVSPLARLRGRVQGWVSR